MKTNQKWYVMQVLTGKEEEVASKLKDARIQAIAPSKIIPERRNGKLRDVRKIVFPGYVFVNVEMTDRIYYFIKGMHNVIRILGNGKPESIPIKQMDAVLHFHNNGHDFGISEGVRKGKKFVITSGALKKFSPKITKVDIRNNRVTVKVPLLKSNIEVICGIKVVEAEAETETY